MARKSTVAYAKAVLTPAQFRAWKAMPVKLSKSEIMAGKRPGGRKAAPVKKRKGKATQKKAAADFKLSIMAMYDPHRDAPLTEKQFERELDQAIKADPNYMGRLRWMDSWTENPRPTRRKKNPAKRKKNPTNWTAASIRSWIRNNRLPGRLASRSLTAADGQNYSVQLMDPKDPGYLSSQVRVAGSLPSQFDDYEDTFGYYNGVPINKLAKFLNGRTLPTLTKAQRTWARNPAKRKSRKGKRAANRRVIKNGLLVNWYDSRGLKHTGVVHTARKKSSTVIDQNTHRFEEHWNKDLYPFKANCGYRSNPHRRTIARPPGVSLPSSEPRRDAATGQFTSKKKARRKAAARKRFKDRLDYQAKISSKGLPSYR
jgi:hypothetical protein